MDKIIRIGKLSDQDKFRRQDYRKMTPKERVNALLALQSSVLRWDLNPKLPRVGILRKVDFHDITRLNR